LAQTPFVFQEVVMKKPVIVLLLLLCACSLIFGQASSSRRRLFNEARRMIGKQAPSGWVKKDGQLWKNVDIVVGKEYTAVETDGDIVNKAIVGCLFNDSGVRDKWLKDAYDTLIAGGWKPFLDNGEGNWVLGRSGRLVAGLFGDNVGDLLSASVVFLK
jgi:hypothetical protein